MYQGQHVTVIVAAAGSGRRMGSGVLSKPFMPLAGVPLLIHTLARFSQAELVDEIVVVCAGIAMERTQELVRQYRCQKVTRIVEGGDERQDSVRAGMDVISAEARLVMVHDAARPFIREEPMKALAGVAIEHGAAIMAVRAKDTIKEAGSDLTVIRTMDRDRTWQVQTPQAFRPDVLRQAHDRARLDGFLGTDEAMLVERLGVPIHIVEGDYFNLKITTPEDWPLAEAILKHHADWFSI